MCYNIDEPGKHKKPDQKKAIYCMILFILHVHNLSRDVGGEAWKELIVTSDYVSWVSLCLKPCDAGIYILGLDPSWSQLKQGNLLTTDFSWPFNSPYQHGKPSPPALIHLDNENVYSKGWDSQKWQVLHNDSEAHVAADALVAMSAGMQLRFNDLYLLFQSESLWIDFLNHRMV